MEALSKKIVQLQPNIITKLKETLRLWILARNQHSGHQKIPIIC